MIAVMTGLATAAVVALLSVAQVQEEETGLLLCDPLLIRGTPGGCSPFVVDWEPREPQTFSWLDISVLGEPDDGCELEILGKISIPEGMLPSSDWPTHSWTFLDRGDGAPPDAQWNPSEKFWIQFLIEGVAKLLLHADGTIVAATDCGTANEGTP